MSFGERTCQVKRTQTARARVTYLAEERSPLALVGRSHVSAACHGADRTSLLEARQTTSQSRRMSFRHTDRKFFCSGSGAFLTGPSTYNPIESTDIFSVLCPIAETRCN